MNPLLPQRLASALLIELASGNYRDGERFLSIRKIIHIWRVSYQTATRALEQLKEWELLTSTDRSGHYLQKGFRQKALLLLESSQQIALPPPQNWVDKARDLLHGKEPLNHIAVVIQCDVAPDSTEARPDVLLQSLSRYYFTRSAQAIFRLATKDKITVNFYVDDSTPGSWQRIVKSIKSNSPQGVIILQRLLKADITTIARPLLNRGIPIVATFSDCANTNMVSITLNNIQMGYTAVKKLIEAGHRTIGVSLPDQVEHSAYFTDRLSGAQLAAKDSRLPVTIIPLCPEELQIENNVRFAPLFAKNNPQRITALFTTNADTPHRLIHAFRKARLRLPRDLSLIACSATPRLPSVKPDVDILKIDFEKIGTEAFNTLLALYAGHPTKRFYPIECQYESHGSVVPPALSSPIKTQKAH